MPNTVKAQRPRPEKAGTARKGLSTCALGSWTIATVEPIAPCPAIQRSLPPRCGTVFMHNPSSPQGFSELGVGPGLVGLLREAGIVTPTPIQAAAIPIALTGRDLIGLAETGTGKTLAFGLPIASRLREGQCALVLAPTRELAEQIAETLQRLRVRTALVVGGRSVSVQAHQLRKGPQVIVATPGRLIDHMNQRTAHLGRVSLVVLDEADRMLDMGFAPPIRRILGTVPKERQTLLFSATLPPDIEALATEFQRDPAKVEVARPGATPKQVQQEVVYVEWEAKTVALAQTLDRFKGPILVFVRTRHGARKMAKHLLAAGYAAGEIHADRTQNQRREALAAFKSGEVRVLVATDVAARGIDVKDVELVLNYDVPEKPEDYIHRIGRTGRAGAAGRALTFALPAQRKDVRDIERLLGEEIPVSRLSSVSPPPDPGHDRPLRQHPPAAKVTNPVPVDRPHAPKPEGHGGDLKPRKPKRRPTPAAAAPPPAARPGHRGWSGRPNKGRPTGRPKAR